MAPTNPDETVQFLLSCIRYSNSGKVSPIPLTLEPQLLTPAKVDFNEVARECSIVSRAAAYVTAIS
jgi:hypothetical protein